MSPRFGFGVVVLVAVLAGIAATASAHHSSNEDELVTRLPVSGASGSRDFCLGPTNIAGCGAASPGDEDFAPGESFTFFYREDVTLSPAFDSPDTVIIRVVLDDQDDEGPNQIIELHNGPPPSTGSTFTFWFTTDGTATGTPASGTVRFYLRVIDDNAVDALDYDCDSDFDATTGVSVNCDLPVTGYARSLMDVESFSCSSPPAGSTFAFGTSGNEQVTCTVTYTRPYASLTYQDVNLATIRGDLSVVVSHPNRDAETDGDTSESDTIDLTFDAASASYGIRFQVSGASPLVGGGYTWTELNTTITDGTRDSDTQATKTGLFTADPRIVFSTDGSTRDNGVNTDESVYNRGETVTYDFWLLNARDEQLTRSMTIQVRASDSTLVDSQSKTGPNYSGSYVIAATDPATADTVGDLHFFRATNTDQTQDSGSAHGVSSKYFVDAHVQLNPQRVDDEFPLENVSEDLQYVSGEDIIHMWCHVVGVRQDVDIDTTSASSVQLVIRDDQGNQQLSGNDQTGADGWTTPAQQTPAVPPLGEWQAECTVNHSGNTGNQIQFFAVGSAFTGNKVIKVWHKQIMGAGTTYRIWAMPELNTDPVEPDGIPRIRVRYICTNGDTSVIALSFRDMLNAQDNTPTVNGTLYYQDITPVFDSDCVFENDAALNYAAIIGTTINGTLVQTTSAFEVQEEAVGSLPDIGILEPAVAGFTGVSDEDSFSILFWIVVTAIAVKVGMPVLAFWTSLSAISVLIPSDPLPFSFAILAAFVLFWIHVLIKIGARARETLQEL